jgi:PAS domain S-box-containing protein
MSKTIILIVEDEAIIAADLVNKLDQLGYEAVGPALSGEEAVSLARSLQPDLVLMDIHLNGTIDGVEAAEQIRRECDLPVIYLTAHSDHTTLERAKLTEPFGYILKPFEEPELQTHIQMALHRHETERKLRESEARFRAAFEHGAIPMALTSLEQRFIRVNMAFCQMVGYSETDLVNHDFLTLTHPEDLAANRANLDRVISGGLRSFRLEKRYLHRDGRIIWGDMSTASVLDSQGHPLYLVTHVQDITERKRIGLELESTNEELLKVNEELQTTNEELQNASEELRTASEELQVRNTQLAALTQQLRLNNEQLEQRVIERTDQLRALAGELTQSEERERRRIAKILHDDLQQLLVAAKLHLELVSANKNPKAMLKDLQRVKKLIAESNRVARSLSHELSPAVLHGEGLGIALKWLAQWMAQHHHLSVRVETDASLEPLEENVKVVLFQSVRELLFNVVKHSGVKRARVRMGVSPDGQLEILVSDKGKGFNPSPSKKRRITNPGFGLFSIHERLQWLGGRMEIQSAPGHGSQFHLLVPAHEHPPRKEPASAPLPTPRVVAQAPNTKNTPDGQARIRILLADDHKVMRDGLGALLEQRLAVEVVGVAANGLEALERIGKLQPDLVIMDINMPHLNGIEATQQIKATWPHIKVIGLTLYPEKRHHDAMRQAGAADCLLKSGPAQALIKAIRTALPRAVPV